MKRKLLILLLVVGLISLGWGEERTALASIPPLQSLSSYITGSLWKVSSILPYNASPHTFEPTPETFRLVEKARLIVINGGDVDAWISKLIKGSSKIVNVSSNIPFEDNNPHIWLDPILAKKIAENIYKKLIEVDGSNKAIYEKNLKVLLNKLDKLDKEIRERLSRFKKKEVIVYHPAWYYFFKRYNIKTVGVIEEGEGKEPSPKKIVEIINIIKKNNIKYIISEPFNRSPVLNTISKETNVKIITLDPLGFGKDYFDLLRENVKKLEKIFDEQNS